MQINVLTQDVVARPWLHLDIVSIAYHSYLWISCG